MILFLSEYPQTEEQFRDGFFQRVVDIDGFFLKDDRTYLAVSPFKNFKKKCIQKDNLKFLYCNFFLHFFLIVRLFKKAEIVYIQSLFNTLNTFIFITFIRNKYVLDLHGVVPEELALNGKPVHNFVFSFIENIIFKRLSFVIAVTKRLENHYRQKYPGCKAKYIVYAILPKNLNHFDITQSKEDIVNIIYSGNTQKWQNIDLMLQSIKNNMHPNFKYQILTGDIKGMNLALDKFNLTNSSSIDVKSVSPSELKAYYEIANYGFILRDDIVVNNVACPTKLIEYMNYGIIPIVLSENIGDFKDLGYEKINVSELNKNLTAKKSTKNIEIIKSLLSLNKRDLKMEILK